MLSVCVMKATTFCLLAFVPWIEIVSANIELCENICGMKLDQGRHTSHETPAVRASSGTTFAIEAISSTTLLDLLKNAGQPPKIELQCNCKKRTL